MPGRTVNFYLVKLNRASAWCLLAVMLPYICSGFAMWGKAGLDKLMRAETALAVHHGLSLPLVGLFLVHSSLSVYFAMRRWGWISRRANR